MNCAESVEFYPKSNDRNFVKEKIKGADAVINCWTMITGNSLKNSSVKYMGNWGH